MPMIFKISDMGAFTTLVNWEQVRDAYVRQMEMSLPPKPDSVALAGIIDKGKDIYTIVAMTDRTMFIYEQFHFLASL